jgi:putative nucleotidyltransferase with HDIG domain
MTLDKQTLRKVSLETLSIVDDVPTLPDRFMKIQAILDDADSTLDDLTRIIETDQATSSIILKVANSSYYNPLGAPVSSLAYAISRLGRQETGDIALSMSLLYGFAIPASISIIRQLWAHAFATAQISRFITVQNYSEEINPDTIFMAALLHDIGRIILGMRIDMSYFERDFCALENDKLIFAEQQTYGIDHAEVGKIVLKLWGLPADIFDVVASHHNDNPNTMRVRICQFADHFAAKHLGDTLNIEDVQMKLKEGLLDIALKDFTNSSQT